MQTPFQTCVKGVQRAVRVRHTGGLGTLIEEGGRNLSAGQVQLLSLARALRWVHGFTSNKNNFVGNQSQLQIASIHGLLMCCTKPVAA